MDTQGAQPTSSWLRQSVFVSCILALTLASIGIGPALGRTAAAGNLIKLACLVGAKLDDPCRSVYYLAANGKRYVFPNQKTFQTWYQDFSTVQIVGSAELSSYPIGGNVTYRPGKQLVKITTDPKVYAVGGNATLRWVTTAELAAQLFGADWVSLVEDVPDAFFVNYSIGSEITASSQYDRTALLNAAQTFASELGEPTPPAPPGGTVTLANVQAVVAGTAVVITWTTPVATQSTLTYAASGGTAITVAENTASLTHSISLADLTPQTLYTYGVNAVATDGATYIANDLNFTTTSSFQSANVTPANWATFQLTTQGSDISSPRISAFDQNVFGVIWLATAPGESGSDVFFSRLNAAGDQDRVIRLTTSARVLHAALATNGIQYRIVWVEGDSEGIASFYTLSLTAQGDIAQAPVKIFSDSYTVLPDALSLVYNGLRYGLTWSARAVGQAYQEIYFLLLGPDGTPAKSVFQVTARTENSTQPKLSWNGNSFGLVFRSVGTSNADILYLPLDDLGNRSLIPAEVLVNDTTNQYPDDPHIAGGYQNEFVISWYDFNSGSQYMRQQAYWKIVDDTGSEVLNNVQLTDYDQGSDAFSPVIVWNDGLTYILWHRSGQYVYLTSTTDSSTLQRDKQLLMTGTGLSALDAVIAQDVVGAVWLSESTGNAKIHFTAGQ